MLSKHLILTNTKEANDARATERGKLGIGRNYKIPSKRPELPENGLTLTDYIVDAGDSKYYENQGVSNKFSEEL